MLRSGLLLYTLCAAVVLVAAGFAFAFADQSAATLRTLAGILFWGAGVSLIAIGVIAISRRFGSGR